MEVFEFKLPDLAEGTTEGEIAAWYVTVGEVIKEDQPLVSVMTDKAVIDIPSPVGGTVVSLHGTVGGRVPVGSVLVVFKTGDVSSEKAPRGPEASPVTSLQISSEPEPSTISAEIASVLSDPSQRPEDAHIARPMASPAVRRRARESGLKLNELRGSGPEGRILHSDLVHTLSAAPNSRACASPQRTPAEDAAIVTEMPIIGVRRKIAERMAQAKRTIPHFSYIEEVDVTELEALRTHLNAERIKDRPKLTPLPFIMRALACVLPSYPDINATYDGDKSILHRHTAIHIGIATQTPSGLLVPVIRHVEACDLWDCAIKLGQVTAAARAGSSTREELAGSTITLTSLGLLGGVAATPIINLPEVAILGLNRIIERPVVHSGQIAIRKMMNLSSSFDHRIVDGYMAADFIQRMKVFLEVPAKLFLVRI